MVCLPVRHSGERYMWVGEAKSVGEEELSIHSLKNIY